MPLYIVKDTQADEDSPKALRLISAVRPASALRHAVESRFTVSAPSALDMYHLGKLGVDIEDADAEPDADAGAEETTDVRQPEDGPQEQDAAIIPAGWQVEPVADEQEEHEPFSRQTDPAPEQYPDAAPSAPSRGRSVIDAIEDDGEDRLTDAEFTGQAED